MKDSPNILLVNPWIHDFAAYDVWAKPLGLLYLGSILRAHGCSIFYIDCLNRFHPRSSGSDPKARNGRGPYLKTSIAKPRGLDDIPRTFSRYGILPEWFREDLQAVPRPDLVLITSLMTYWYPGVFETISMIKTMFPETPVVLGGVYATLCHEHAAGSSGADRVITGPGEKHILDIVGDYTGFSEPARFDPEDFDAWPYPALDLQTRINYVPLLTSRGCPYACAYCASHFIYPQRTRRRPESVVDEIKYWHTAYGVVDFAFYDDALLVDGENHAIPMFESIVRSDMAVRFHTPNALHVREITETAAQLMFKAGFTAVRLGLETAAFDKRDQIDSKVTAVEFKTAVSRLLEAGFDRSRIGAYLLAGLPGQTLSSIEESINTVRQSGITPIPAYYTPIPHTGLWNKAIVSSRYDLEADPIFTNNAVLPCQKDPFSWETVSRLKSLCTQETGTRDERL